MIHLCRILTPSAVLEIIFSYSIISGFNYSPKNIDCLLVFLSGSKLI